MTIRITALALTIVAIGAGAATAQVAPSRPTSLDQQRFNTLDAARADQQRQGDVIQQQGVAAAQQRLRTQQTLQSLQATRPPAPLVPDNFPTSSGVRRPGAAPSETPPAPVEPSSLTALPPSDPATRGDLPL